MTKSKYSTLAGTVLACAALAVGGVRSASAAPVFNLVNDGGFEDPFVGGTFNSYNAGDNFGAWHVDSGGVDLINTYWTSAEGVQSVDMNGTSAGSISQTIGGLSVGQQYQLSFFLAGNPAGGPTIKDLQTSLGGNVLGSNSFDITGKSTSDMGWTQFTYNFTAADSSTLLSFQSLTSAPCTGASALSACGPALDDVSIRAVPEASTVTGFAIMLFGGIVMLARKQKQSKSAA